MTPARATPPTPTRRRDSPRTTEAQPKGTLPSIVETVPEQARKDQAGLVALALGLAVVAVYAKWLLLPFPVTTFGELVRYLLRLAIVVSPDICFVATLAGICHLMSTVAGRSCRLARLWLPLRNTLFAAVALYALASVGIYKLIMLPATVRLLAVIGNPKTMASSIIEHARPEMIAFAVVVTSGIALLPCFTRRLPWFRRGAPVLPVVVFVGGALVAMYGATCHVYIRSHWTDPNRWERRIARSAHVVLLASFAEELVKERSFTASFTFTEVDESDFYAATVRRDDGAGTAAAHIAERPKNAIVIVLESVGAQYLDVYGARYPTAPRIKQLARRRGVVFENAYVQAASSCKSLLTLSAAVYPRPDWLLVVRDCIDFNVPTIAEVLSAEGYRTAYLHSGTWGWKRRDRFLRGRGIDTLIDSETLPGPQVSSWGVSDRSMFRAALNWIDREPNSPFFLFAYTIETHHPYVVTSRAHDFGVEDPELARYLNAIRATDATIGWFVNELKRRGLDRSTVIVITSDHGESFGQNGQRLHNFGIYEPIVHVPLVMLHSSLREANLPARVEAVCQHIDVPPTLLDLLGVPIPDVWQGRSLLKNDDPRRAYFLATGNQIVLGLRDGRLKYHYYVDNDHEELFDLEADPGELINLAPRQHDRCILYRRRVGGLVRYQRRFLAQHGAP